MNFAKAAGKNTPTLPFDFQLYRDRSFTYMRDQKKNTGSERTCQTPRTSNSTLSPTNKKESGKFNKRFNFHLKCLNVSARCKDL